MGLLSRAKNALVNVLKKGAEFVGKAVGAVVSAVTEVGKAVVKGFSNANNRVQDFISLDETRQSVSAISTQRAKILRGILAQRAVTAEKPQLSVKPNKYTMNLAVSKTLRQGKVGILKTHFIA